MGFLVKRITNKMGQEIKIVVGDEKKPAAKKAKKVKKALKKAVAPDQFKRVRSEIVQLEELKTKSGKGVRGFLRRMSLTKKISDRRQFLSTKDKLASVKQQTEFVKARVDFEKARGEVKESKKKQQVDFGGLFAPPKKIEIDDIFK